METNPSPFHLLLIGATALAIGYCVVTNNQRHYARIPGVQVVN
jgi:predicted nucleic acid-binding protein